MNAHSTPPLPALYAIVNLEAHQDPLVFIRGLLSAGVDLLQLRAKQMPTSRFEALAVEVCRLVRSGDWSELATNRTPKVIVNDDVELCHRVGADGVHLGLDDESPELARARLGDRAMIGLSTHTREQFRKAPFEVLSYIALGPIFLSPTKHGHAELVGIDVLQELALDAPVPVVAIGGITRMNAPLVYAAGASSVAVISDLERAKDLPTVVAQYEAARISRWC